MQLRILKRPSGIIDGIFVDRFQVGGVFELGTHIASVFLAEGWAELVPDDRAVAAPPRPVGAIIGRLVLVVDDDPDVRLLTENLLTAHGYEVVLAVHGKDAIQRLRNQCSPDLIVLDLNMPVMDGWNFRAEQRYLTDATRAATPVLVMSAEDDAETHAEQLRAVGVIRKPFDPDDLLEAISAAIGSQNATPYGIRPPPPPTPGTGRKR
jgi:CheY-like chemotaxis protein